MFDQISQFDLLILVTANTEDFGSTGIALD